MTKEMRVRHPKKVFETLVDGYNIETMYNKVMDYLDENGEGRLDSYHHCLIIVETNNKERDVFGAFISASPINKPNFVGTFASFVFTAHVEDEVTIYQQSQEVNKYYMQCEANFLMIGSGPAFRLDKELFKGESNYCETFDSPILLKFGEKYSNDMFETKNLEVFIL